MAQQTVYFKDHEEIGHNSISATPWWGALGSQSVYGEACGKMKTLSFENPFNGDQNATKQVGRIEQGGCKKIGDGQKVPAITLQSSVPEYRARFELGFDQPMICAKYPYEDPCCGLFQTYGTQMPGRIMLPLSLTTDDGPIYVNPKQYHAILRRRKSRAKAVMQNRLTRARQPYMHESRHLHAMRRPRGCGGRFLNSKSLNNVKNGTEPKNVDEEKLSPIGSQRSEVLQSDSGTLNSSKEANGGNSNISGSEVTSIYSRGYLNLFQFSHFRPSLQSLLDILDGTGHGMVMPSWVGAADHSCCNVRT